MGAAASALASSPKTSTEELYKELQQLLGTKSHEAKSAGAVMPLNGAFEPIGDGFALVFRDSAMEAKRKADQEAAAEAGSDPFAAGVGSPRTVAAEVGPDGEYSLVLEPYPVLESQSLLGARGVAGLHSNAPLDVRDWLAIWPCLTALYAVALVDSGIQAGGLARGKRVKLLPEAAVCAAMGGASYWAETAVCAALDAADIAAGELAPLRGHPCAVPALRGVAHAAARLPPWRDDDVPESPERVGSALCAVYHSLLFTAGLDEAAESPRGGRPPRSLATDPDATAPMSPAPAYSLLVTRRWMLVVARSHPVSKAGVPVGAEAFLGLISPLDSAPKPISAALRQSGSTAALRLLLETCQKC